MMRCIVTMVASLWVFAAAAQDPWPLLLFDPAAEEPRGPDGAMIAADLMLPMPCGGSMAFQRVMVPVDVDRPIDDRPFRMGQSDEGTGFSDYLTSAHLRGPFTDSEAGVSYYYIARYELNVAQYRAITGDCEAPFTPRDRFAQGNLSWFDAVDLARNYTEWLLGNAPDAIPSQDGRTGFLRLPTEIEWEYAVRGGVKADPAVFPARRFFQEGELSDYAHFQAPGQGRGKLRPVGLRDPNAVGLFDVYGNAEELMLEPFRLNAIGRPHGQAGGLVTRGGSIDREDAQIYTAQRSEYPMFSPISGKALASEFFGVRFAISANVVSDADYDLIRDTWIAEADRPAVADADPLATLSTLLDGEIDPRRRDALTGLEFEFRVVRDRAEQSLAQAAKSTLLSGAAFVDTLVGDTREIDKLQRDSLSLLDRVKIAVGDQRRQLMESLTQTIQRRDALQDARATFLLSYRATLETLIDEVEAETRQAVFDDLSQELEAAGQQELTRMLQRFWGDLEAYEAEPDMSPEDLLKIAVR